MNQAFLSTRVLEVRLKLVVSHLAEAGSFFSLFVNYPWWSSVVSVYLPLQLKRCLEETRFETKASDVFVTSVAVDVTSICNCHIEINNKLTMQKVNKLDGNPSKVNIWLIEIHIHYHFLTIIFCLISYLVMFCKYNCTFIFVLLSCKKN